MFLLEEQVLKDGSKNAPEAMGSDMFPGLSNTKIPLSLSRYLGIEGSWKVALVILTKDNSSSYFLEMAGIKLIYSCTTIEMYPKTSLFK